MSSVGDARSEKAASRVGDVARPLMTAWNNLGVNRHAGGAQAFLVLVEAVSVI